MLARNLNGTNVVLTFVMSKVAKLSVSCATAILFMSLASTAFAADRINIVIILADDLGYGSLNSNGASESHLRTPNIATTGDLANCRRAARRSD